MAIYPGYPGLGFGGGGGGEVTVDGITDAGAVGKDVLRSEDQPAARDALGLGGSATKNAGTATGDVMPVGAFGLGVGAQHKADAYGNIAEFFRVNSSSANRPNGNNAYGCVRLPIDGGPTTAYLAGGGDLSLWVGRSTTQSGGVTWTRAYTEAYPQPIPFAGYTTPGKITSAESVKLLWANAWPDARDDGQQSGRFSFGVDGVFQVNYFWKNLVAYVSTGGLVINLPAYTDISSEYDDGDYIAPISTLLGQGDNAYLSSYLDKDVLTITNHATSTQPVTIKANWKDLSGNNIHLISADGGSEIDMVTTGLSLPVESSITIRWDNASQRLQEI